MRTYEFKGKNTEDAIENACRTLNIEKDMMEIEILESGSAGIFGLVGGRKARIQVRVLSPKAEPEKEPEEMILRREPETDTDEVPSIQESISSETEAGVSVAKAALENILALIPIENTTVKAKQTDGIIFLEIEGDKSGLLIGRKGRTLDALQFIVNKIANKALEKRIQVVIDSESYRQRRKEFLTQMALEMGAKAKKSKKPVTTNLLYPQDRRVIHLALKDDSGLSTKSRGDGLFKKVVIIPKG